MTARVPEDENKPYRPPWWSGGVFFSCIGCGRCCRGEPGAIFFTLEEGRRAREFLNLDEEKFTRRFVTLRWGRPSYVERANGECVFYRASDAKCSIYSVRPAQCSLFPFWPSVLASRAAWAFYARGCLGMGQGRHYGAEEIEALLKECPFDDL